MADLTGMLQATAGAVEPVNPNAWDISKAYYDAGSDAWDISTSVYSTKFFSTVGLDGRPTGVFFKSDGTKMYFTGISGQDVTECSLSAPWDVSTASSVQNFSVAAQDTTPENLFFKSDGTKMYILGDQNNAVYEYTLSTAWDISTASYVQSFSVSTEEGTPTGLFFKPDGTKMYVTGAGGDDVNEYDLSSAWDISTASYVQNFSVAAQETGPRGLSFKPDGTKMYLVGIVGDDVNEYSLSTAWDISSASYVQNFSLGATGEGTPESIYFKEDGSMFFMSGSGNDRVYQYFIGGFSVAAQEASPTDLFFKPDGTKMYVIGFSGDYVNEYSLSTAWDVSSASYVQNFSVASQETNPQGLFFKPDGTKMFIVGGAGDDVNEYSLSSAWDISTASYVQNFSVSTQDITPSGLFFKPDGTKMYVTGATGDDVNEFGLSSAWDISTASYTQNFSVASQDTQPLGLFFKPDGTKMYIIGSSTDTVCEYDLSSAWDISTASYVQNFSIIGQEAIPSGLSWKEDGTQFWIIGSSSDRVFSYLISEE